MQFLSGGSDFSHAPVNDNVLGCIGFLLRTCPVFGVVFSALPLLRGVFCAVLLYESPGGNQIDDLPPAQCVSGVFALRSAARWDVMSPLLFRCVVSSLVSFFFGCAILARGW